MVTSKVLKDIETATIKSRSASGIAIREHFSLSNLRKTLLFLHHRFSNLPIELIVPLFRNMLHDLEWVQSPENNSAVPVTTVAQFSNIETIVFICPCSLSTEDNSKLLSEGDCIDILGSSSVLFDNFEDETFFENCTSAILYNSQGLKRSLAAMLLPLSKVSKCFQALDDMIPQPSVEATALSSKR